MKNYLKQLLAIALLFSVMTACDQKTGAQLSTDLVTNPKSATHASDNQAAIKFDKEEHDFGSLLQGEVVSYSFYFTNTGNQPLIITSVGSSCGCTVGDYPREPIAPGEKGNIKVTYDSKGHRGFQSRSLTVMSNTMPAKTVLRIKGKVLTPDQY